MIELLHKAMTTGCQEMQVIPLEKVLAGSFSLICLGVYYASEDLHIEVASELSPGRGVVSVERMIRLGQYLIYLLLSQRCNMEA
jgi:hypothetical protein